MWANFLTRLYAFFSKPFFSDRRYIIGIWLLVAIITAAKQWLTNHPEIGKITINNYFIFKYVYLNSVAERHLYAQYPQWYGDSNHYGPFFSILISPFALLPDWLGIILWNLFNTLVLVYGIFMMPLEEKKKVFVTWICTNELITAQLATQFNIAITGLILLAYVYSQTRQYVASGIATAIGILVKLYGSIGIVFILFARDRARFFLSYLLAFMGLFCLPVLITGWDFYLKSYLDWKESLIEKSTYNVYQSGEANKSFGGLLHKVFGIDIPVQYMVLFGGSVLMGLLWLNRKNFHHRGFQINILSYLLLCLVLFNTGVESPTFIIGFVGVGLWYVNTPRTKWSIALLIFAFVLTSLSPTDIFPTYLRKNFVEPYALKALPCVLIWFHLCYQIYAQRRELPAGGSSL